MYNINMDSKQLIKNTNQHKQKNTKSHKQDKTIMAAAKELVILLKNEYEDFDFILDKKISYPNMIERAVNGTSREYDDIFNIPERTIAPDGGVVYAVKGDFKWPILVSETKRQGTNDLRKLEGLKKQATGNAIERLGKNASAVKMLFARESITPFLVFGQGYDFYEDNSASNFVLAKLSAINEFYPLNSCDIQKDEITFENDNSFVYSRMPFFFRFNDWTKDEILEKMVLITNTSMEYYKEKYG